MQEILRKPVQALVLFAILIVGGNALAQDNMMKSDGGMMKHDAKPTVVIVRADWCPACHKVKPILDELKAQYGERLNFVVLNVTNDEMSKEAAMTANQLGLAKFFEANKKKTSTVAIFDAHQKSLFKTDHNYSRDAYVKAFDGAIASHKM